MPRARANGIEIEFEAFGDASCPPVLLVMGLGGQMLLWDDDFCETLAGRGHRVVRFDNRDVGLSTKFESHGLPDVFAAFAKMAQGQPIDAPYTLHDMADDAAALLDEIGIEATHVVGASMGGMIAQTLSFRHAPRVRSLVSIMSTTGNPALPAPKPDAMATLTVPPPTERDANIEHAVELWRTIGSPGFPFDEDFIRQRATRLYDRCFHPEGVARQLVAILASGDRRPHLAGVRAPSLVIHGIDDPLVPIEGGRDTAAAIPGAELMEIPGMGHDMPRALWPTLIDAITKHVERAERARAA